jgi:predicted nucleic acid-binding protein
MSLLVDTGIAYAYYDRSDRWHEPARAVITGHHGGLILPSPVIPEVDHLLGHRLGVKARLTFYRAIVEGHYLVADLPQSSYLRVVELNRQFSDLELGFVDAAIVAMAEVLGLTRIATADRRHFEPVAAALGLALAP